MLFKLFLAIITALLIVVGAVTSSMLAGIDIDFIGISATLFTALAAIATAYAALSAARSASIAEKSTNIWKSQMALEIELNEANSIRVALNAWHRHFISESESKRATHTLEQLVEHFQVIYESPSIYVEHLQQYCDELHRLWCQLETAFDQANFIENDFEARMRLRRLHLEHYKGCKDFLIHVQNEGKYHPALIEILVISKIYNFKNWHEIEMAKAPIHKIEMEQKLSDGSYQKIKKTDGSFCYSNPFEEVYSWWVQIDVMVRGQIDDIKVQLKNI